MNGKGAGSVGMGDRKRPRPPGVTTEDIEDIDVGSPRSLYKLQARYIDLAVRDFLEFTIVERQTTPGFARDIQSAINITAAEKLVFSDKALNVLRTLDPDLRPGDIALRVGSKFTIKTPKAPLASIQDVLAKNDISIVRRELVPGAATRGLGDGGQGGRGR